MNDVATTPIVGRSATASPDRSLTPHDHPGRVPFLASSWGTGLAFVGMIAEFAALSFAIDTGSIDVAGPFAAVVDFAPELVRIALVSLLFAGLLVGPGRLRPLLRSFLRSSGRHASRTSWGPIHVLTTCVFGVMTVAVCRPGVLSGELGGLWFLAWCALAAATCGTALLTLAPSGFWRDALGENVGRLAAAVLLGTGAWGAGQFTRTGTAGLVDGTFACVTALLELLGFAVVADPAKHVIGTNGFVVHVAPGCSGYEGLGLVSAFLVGFVVVARNRLRFPNALILLPLGAALALTANVLRIALLIAIGSAASPELALGGFHSQAGWVTFNVVALGTMALGLTCPWFARPTALSSTSTAASVESPATMFLLPLLTWLAAGMVLEAVCPNPTLAYAGKTLAAVAVLIACRSAFAGIAFRVSPFGLLAGVVTFGLWYVIGRFEATTPIELPTDPWWIVARFVGSVLVVPVVEELAFRGYLMRRWVSPDVTRVPLGSVPFSAILVTSIGFGLLHGWWVAGTVAGVVLGLTAKRRGLGDAIVAHAVANLLVAVAAVSGETWLW